MAQYTYQQRDPNLTPEILGKTTGLEISQVAEVNTPTCVVETPNALSPEEIEILNGALATSGYSPIF